MARVHIFATLEEKVRHQHLLLLLLPSLHLLKLNATPQKNLTTHYGILDADRSARTPDHLSLDKDELFHSGADAVTSDSATSWTLLLSSAHGTITLLNGHQRPK